jgi:hypothetical protein
MQTFTGISWVSWPASLQPMGASAVDRAGVNRLLLALPLATLVANDGLELGSTVLADLLLDDRRWGGLGDLDQGCLRMNQMRTD